MDCRPIQRRRLEQSATLEYIDPERDQSVEANARAGSAALIWMCRKAQSLIISFLPDRVYVEGRIKLRSWARKTDGQRSGLSAPHLGLQTPCVQDRLGVAVGLLATLENEIARRLKRHRVVEVRRHRPVQW